MLEIVTLAAAQAQLQTKFRVRVPDSQVLELELVEAVDKGVTAWQEQFSLMFCGPLDSFLPQQTYEVEHDQFGTFAIFLVPVARKAESYTYEAYFNRLVQQEAR